MKNIVETHRWRGWAAVGIGSDLRHIELLYNEGEKLFAEQLIDFEKEFQEKTKDWDDESKSEYGDYLSDEHWKLSEVFPQIFRSSILSTCYSRLEYELIDLCNNLNQNNSNIEKSSTKLYNILDCKEYLINKVGVIENIFKDEWSNILVYKFIRNNFTHYSGLIEKGKEDIEEYCNRNPTLASVTHSKILLHSAFCDRVIKDINEQLLSLYDYFYQNNIKTDIMDSIGAPPRSA